MNEESTVRLEFSELGQARLIATDRQDDCSITDAIDIGADGSYRRIWLLKELVRREGLFLVNKHGKKML